MKTIWLDVPAHVLEERRRMGGDRWDEMWEGVLHMVPPPSGWHQLLESHLHLRLAPIALKLGFECTTNTGVFRPGDLKDYRQPDLAVAPLSAYSKPGIVGAPQLVVEILSPGDESYEKLGFYGELGVKEAIYVEPETRAVELFVLRGGKLLPLSPDEKGAVRSAILGVALLKVDGPKLRLAWEGGAAEI